MAQYAPPSHNNTIFSPSDFNDNSTGNPTLSGANAFTATNSFTKVITPLLTTGIATVSNQLILPTVVTGPALGTLNICTISGNASSSTINIGGSYGTDCKAININASGNQGTVTIGNAGNNSGGTINLHNNNRQINILSSGTSITGSASQQNGISIGAYNLTASLCPVNINTLGGSINTAATTIGTATSACNIVGSSTIGTTNSDTLTINANVTGTSTSINLSSATITATNFVGNVGVTGVATTYYLAGTSNFTSGNYGMQTDSGGHISFTPSTNTLLLGGGTTGNISVIGTASSIQVAGTGIAFSGPNCTGCYFPAADVTALSFSGCTKAPITSNSGTATIVGGALVCTPSVGALSSYMQFTLNIGVSTTLSSFAVTGIRLNTTFTIMVTTGVGATLTIPIGMTNCKINNSTNLLVIANSYAVLNVTYIANSSAVPYYFISNWGNYF